MVKPVDIYQSAYIIQNFFSSSDGIFNFKNKEYTTTQSKVSLYSRKVELEQFFPTTVQ